MFWGSLGDRLGRRRALIYCLGVGSIFSGSSVIMVILQSLDTIKFIMYILKYMSYVKLTFLIVSSLFYSPQKGHS